MTSLLDAPPAGVQVPTHRLAPSGNRYAADEAIGLAESVGLRLDPWQMAVLVSALGEQDDGRWSAFEVGVQVARQNGKGAILEARELAGLFLFGEQLILHSAHEFRTCSEAFRRLRWWVDNSDDLRRRVKRITTAAGNEGIELLNGGRIRFVARSRGSGRGFSGDLIVLDEAMILSRASVAAMLPALSARPNPQIWYAGSAPFEDSLVWHGVRRRALDAIRTGDRSGRLAWCGWETPAGADIADEAQWARVNPALGIRIGVDHVRAELDAMAPDDFARERLCVPDALVTDGHGPIDPGVWAGLDMGGRRMSGMLAVGVDVAPNLEHGAVGVAGSGPQGERLVEVVDARVGSSWIPGRVAELVDRHPDIGVVVVDPRSPASGIVNELRQVCQVAGIPLVEVSTAEHVRAVGSILQRISAGSLLHRSQPVLDSAVRAARLRKLGDAAAFSRRSSADNIAPLVAVTLAAGVLDDLAAEPPEQELMNLQDMVHVI